MSVWKQTLVSLFILLVAGGLWVRFFPGADALLDKWGLDWAVAAVVVQEQPAAGVEPQGMAAAGSDIPTVVASSIGQATINDRLTAIGTGRALSSVSVTPFSAGRLVEVVVESGARVEAGDVIARLDQEVEEIAVDRARIALEDARSRLERIATLRSSNTASAVQVTEAELNVSNAELELRNAQLALERRAIRAPISGIVGILPVSAGNYVVSSTEIATIDDRSQIVVDFWVPERFASMVAVGQEVSASSVARPSDLFSGEIAALDNRIDSDSRTLRIQARIENPSDTLRAGMSFQVTMNFPGDTYPTVDPLAIQWSAEGAFVWIVDDGKARRALVRIIQRNTDNVLVAGDLGVDGAVVTEGIHSVREGAEIRLARRGDEGRLETQEGGPADTALTGT